MKRLGYLVVRCGQLAALHSRTVDAKYKPALAQRYTGGSQDDVAPYMPAGGF
jgi:hypothetical protein